MTLAHCWWERGRVQPPGKAVWRVLKRLKIDLPCDPAIPLLGISPKELKAGIQRHLHRTAHGGAKRWKHPVSIGR